MSFGFSVGDFVTLSTLAWTIYDSCQSSSVEFKCITGQINTLSIILKRIADQIDKSSVPTQEIRDLLELGAQSYQVLEDINKLLGKYGSLGKKKPRKFQKIKWALKSSSNITNQLLFQANILNYLNTSLTQLSSDRLEQNFNMWVEKAKEDVTMSEKNTSNASASQRLRRYPSDHLTPPLASQAASRCTAHIPKHGEQDFINQSCSDGYSDVSSFETYSQGAPWIEGEKTTIAGSEILANRCYRSLSTDENSVQINGDVGNPQFGSPQKSVYFNMTARGNSFQLNGNVLDLNFLSKNISF